LSVSSDRYVKSNNRHALITRMTNVVYLLGHSQQLITLLTPIAALLQLYGKLLPTCCSELSE
jgi:hypothetical protein